jgi:prepilin-type N-terminal cleavage/methylation domain-containing protein
MRTRCKHFTLIELLVVIAIIAVLAGLLLPALAGAREHAKRTRAQTEMKMLQTAIAMYESDYGVLPMGVAAADRVLTSAEYTAMIGYLQNAPGTLNARGKRYLDISTDQGPGVLNDPWSTTANPQPYKVVLDLNYDGQIDATAATTLATVIYGRVAAWSIGKNHLDEHGLEDDVNSWRQ